MMPALASAATVCQCRLRSRSTAQKLRPKEKQSVGKRARPEATAKKNPAPIAVRASVAVGDPWWLPTGSALGSEV